MTLGHLDTKTLGNWDVRTLGTLEYYTDKLVQCTPKNTFKQIAMFR